MAIFRIKPKNQTQGFLMRLRTDARGSTYAMMAAAVLPLLSMVGGGVDISRLYLAKTRLQQACDAGSLAGRKAMGGGTWTTANQTFANNFFDANFKQGTFGTGTVTRVFTENAGKVTGTASVIVPMTLMKVFSIADQTITVTCDAEQRLPNTDVMFVLDTTGSMAQKAVSTDTETKIEALRTSVKCFYEIVARLDTNATCDGAAPSGGTGNGVQIRFGFVPYATNVNVGKLLPTSYFANSWPYQSRKAVTTTETYYVFDTPGSVSLGSSNNANDVAGSWTTYSTSTVAKKSDCVAPASTTPTSTGPEGAPYNQTTTTSGSTQTVTWDTSQPHEYYEYKDNNNKNCVIQVRRHTIDLIRHYVRVDNGTPETRQIFSQWHYGKTLTDITGLKNGSSWNNSFSLPIGNGGIAKNIGWDGCIEERATVRQTSYSPIPADAKDLDIDLVPTAGDPGSLWGPALPGLIYTRKQTGSGTGSWSNAEVDSATNYTNTSSYYCPDEARKLQAWPTASDFSDYVDGLTPDGNTYHDIGMLWGARFMSPTGIFGSENALTPQGGEIERHMIFMTDGDTNAPPTDYNAYGVPWFDRRQTSAGSSPSQTDTEDQVNARFLALCSAVKNKNITLWVISFGSGSDTTTETRLAACASSGRYFAARSASTLQSTFRSIANQISQLRLTK